MGRRPKAATAETATQTTTSAEGTGAGAPRVIRRRRRRVVDHAAQTQVLVASVLAARGGSGASLEDLQTVVAWARGVNAESVEVEGIKTRVRSARSESSASRIAQSDTNKALLESVMSGKLAVDVVAGSLTFIAAGHAEGNG